VPISLINILGEALSGLNVKIQYKSPQAIKENTKTLAMHCLGRRFMNLSSLTLNEFFTLSPKSKNFSNSKKIDSRKHFYANGCIISIF
jgi:hypothetical protein